MRATKPFLRGALLFHCIFRWLRVCVSKHTECTLVYLEWCLSNEYCSVTWWWCRFADSQAVVRGIRGFQFFPPPPLSHSPLSSLFASGILKLSLIHKMLARCILYCWDETFFPVFSRFKQQKIFISTQIIGFDEAAAVTADDANLHKSSYLVLLWQQPAQRVAVALHNMFFILIVFSVENWCSHFFCVLLSGFVYCVESTTNSLIECVNFSHNSRALNESPLDCEVCSGWCCHFKTWATKARAHHH